MTLAALTKNVGMARAPISHMALCDHASEYTACDTIPIAMLGEGAGKIFDDLIEARVKIVVEGDRPLGVVLSPEEYEHLVDLIEDMRLEEIASLRLSKPSGKLISHEEILAEFGLTREDIARIPEVDMG